MRQFIGTTIPFLIVLAGCAILGEVDPHFALGAFWIITGTNMRNDYVRWKERQDESETSKKTS